MVEEYLEGDTKAERELGREEGRMKMIEIQR